MKPRSWIELALLVAMPISYGCGAFTAQVGLSNAPSSPLDPGAQVGIQYDSVANGPDSCQRNPKTGHDPLRYRLFACPTEEKKAFTDPSLRWVGMLQPAVADGTTTPHPKLILHPSIEEVWPSRQFCYNYGNKARCLELSGSPIAPTATRGTGLGFEGAPSPKMRLLPPW